MNSFVPSILKQLRSKTLQRYQARMASILIYSGKGSKDESRKIFSRSLEETVDLDVHDVKFISADEVKEGSWMSKTKVLCVGGGYDLGYIESLGSSGMRNIREFVSGGGGYLGICAGAYFACDFIEFDKNGPLEVVGERSLKFFQGKCIGPAFAGFDYNSRKGVHAVPVLYHNLEVQAYAEGGGYFMPYDHSSSSSQSQDHSDVLGRYTTLDDSPAAIVKSQYGQGSVVLSGVHIEYPVKCLDCKDKYISKMLPHFFRAEERRKYIFRDLLGSHLGVACLDVPDKSCL